MTKPEYVVYPGGRGFASLSSAKQHTDEITQSSDRACVEDTKTGLIVYMTGEYRG